MKIKFGYVAISMNLKEASPNKTVTFKNLEKLDKSSWQSKLETLAKQNIANTIRILRYNKAYGIGVYRFTSRLIPLATHPGLMDWDWENALSLDFQELGRVVRETEMRVSTHPDHFVLLNSPVREVLKNSVKDLEYHCRMFELMELGPEYKIVLHIGGMYKNREDSIKRFYEGFSQLSDRIRSRIILENDDKIYNIEDVLKICRTLDIPMVLDIHHDRCNPSDREVKALIGDIFDTWKKEVFIPKIHLSSPKSSEEIRSHHEYINPDEFVAFLREITGLTGDFDVMIEAKMKDLALLKLMEDIKKYDFIKNTGDAWIEI